MKFKLLQGILETGTTVRAEILEPRLMEIRIESSKIRKWKRLNSFPLSFLAEKYPEIIGSVTHLKSGTGSAYTRVKVPEELTLQLAYLLGAMRDGSLIRSKGKHWVRIYDSANSTWVESLRDIFQRIFEVTPHVRYQKHIGEKYLDISSKPLYYMISMMVDGKLHKSVPEIIRASDIEIQKSYIAGFFDAEGHVPSANVKNKRARITFTQKDESSLRFIISVLEGLEIKCSSISNYSFAIYGEEMVRKFHANFGLLNAMKLERLQIMSTSVSKSYPGDMK
ncbi:MAG: LAGLIDADG family homing endonuclease [Candidatus Aenigmarchaeota archaeon]|nr:LAGLIDADG family homing endonuclease [Candidatus Aenigmarchaeota archaeon]